VVTPLNLVHVDLSSAGETDILLQDFDWPLTIGQVVVKVNGILINLLEGFGFVGCLETFAKLGDVENVMEFRQLRR
jgi:hypothetical protein